MEIKCRKDCETFFYKGLAEEIKPQGFRCFLNSTDKDVWMYVITPNNSLLYIDSKECCGYYIVYEYTPSKDFGSGCRFGDIWREITAETLLEAERYGMAYRRRVTDQIPNIYDNGCHTETVLKSPKRYKDAYKAMMEHYGSERLVEL